jgi:hypothetical protein
MSTVSARLDAIQTRLDAAAPGAVTITPSDVAWLRDTARKQQAAIDAALALAEEWRYKGEHGWGAWQEGHGPDREGYILDGASADLRAAITEALEAKP